MGSFDYIPTSSDRSSHRQWHCCRLSLVLASAENLSNVRGRQHKHRQVGLKQAAETIKPKRFNHFLEVAFSAFKS